jgi:hypothetical protein
MGWQTFHQFADQDKSLDGLPSGSAYFRFYWREVENKDGEIDFAKFDGLLAHAHRAGQKLAFRIMCTGSGEFMDVPPYLKERGCRGYKFRYGGADHWVPDFADSQFQSAHFRLIRELGRRYDNHPDLDLVDIGSVGLWGEWHMSDTHIEGTDQPVALPEVALRLRIIDAWCSAFPKTSKVILIGSEEGMSQATEKRYGWRADCLGDMGGFSKNWNHMKNFYLQQVEKTVAQDAWKNAPVAFESCWDMRKWKESGWDIRYIFDYALDCHVSYVNNKSAPLPSGTRGEVERFLKRLGYRLVVRELEHPEKAHPGAEFAVKIFWDNKGVAPPYRDYRVALRCKKVGDDAAESPVLPSTESIRGWLPGLHKSELRLAIPATASPGDYQLALGLVEPGTTNPAVRLAISGGEESRWYPVSKLQISSR